MYSRGVPDADATSYQSFRCSVHQVHMCSRCTRGAREADPTSNQPVRRFFPSGTQVLKVLSRCNRSRPDNVLSIRYTDAQGSQMFCPSAASQMFCPSGTQMLKVYPRCTISRSDKQTGQSDVLGIRYTGAQGVPRGLPEADPTSNQPVRCCIRQVHRCSRYTQGAREADPTSNQPVRCSVHQVPNVHKETNFPPKYTRYAPTRFALGRGSLGAVSRVHPRHHFLFFCFSTFRGNPNNLDPG
jgi:hypothetical protein